MSDAFQGLSRVQRDVAVSRCPVRVDYNRDTCNIELHFAVSSSSLDFNLTVQLCCMDRLD